MGEAALERVEFAARNACPLHEPLGAAAPLRAFDSLRDTLTGRTFRILLCPGCGVALTDPYPTASTVRWLYEGRESPNNFDPIRGTPLDRLKDFFARRDVRRFYALSSRAPVKAVLDFGAGNCRFSVACKAVFPDSAVDAVDFDPEPPPSLSPSSGVRYLNHEQFFREHKIYDLIVLRHVIEHVHDPVGFLQSMKDRLSPRGIIYIEVPNLHSASVRLFGSRLNTYSVPYHLFNFSRSSLASVVQSAGGLTAKIDTIRLPFMGCVMAGLLGQKRGMGHQIAGILFHPVQVLLDALYGKFILFAVCEREQS